MDHQRVNIHTCSMSCGVMEMSRLASDVAGVGYAVASRLYHPSRGVPCAFICWSDISWTADHIPNGEAFARWVAAQAFGEVTNSAPQENPHTGNWIVVYTWAINHEAFKKWYADTRMERVRRLAG